MSDPVDPAMLTLAESLAAVLARPAPAAESAAEATPAAPVAAPAPAAPAVAPQIPAAEMVPAPVAAAELGPQPPLGQAPLRTQADVEALSESEFNARYGEVEAVLRGAR
jgi:hypothetical protein